MSEMLQKYEGEWETFICGQEPFIIQSPSDDSQALILPTDVWKKHILPQIDDFWDQLAVGQASKALNYFARRWYHGAMVAQATPQLASNFVLNGDRKWSHMAMFYVDGVLDEARKNKKDKNMLARVRLYVYSRARDLGAIQVAYHYCENVASFPAVPEAEEIAKGLCVVKGKPFHCDKRTQKAAETQYIWLPDYDDGMPLLERFDPRTVAAMIGQNYSRFRTMFFPYIIAQYILPVYHNEKGMTVDTLRPFKLLMKSTAFFQYFHYLFRAFYFFESNFKAAAADRSSQYHKTIKFLQSIGFDTKVFVVCRAHSEKWNDEEYRSEEEMWGILRAAQHWGLKWERIAKKTQDWCQLSKRIMNGEIPEGLHPWEPITPHDVFKVAFCEDPTIERPAYKIVDGFVVLDAVEEKCKRIRERNNERQRNRKRRKLEEAQAAYLAEDRESEGADDMEEDDRPPMWQQPPMPFNNALPFMMMQGPPLAGALPPLQLNYNAFLAPPVHMHQGPQQAMPPAPQVPTQQIPLVPIQQQQEQQGAGQAGEHTSACKIVGTPEQVEIFQAGCMRIVKIISERTGSDCSGTFLVPKAPSPETSSQPIPQQGAQNESQLALVPVEQGQAGTSTIVFKFLGTQEQVKHFQAYCMRLLKAIAVRTGSNCTGSLLTLRAQPVGPNSAQPIPPQVAQNQPQLAQQADQQPNRDETPLESPYFIDPTELNKMDLDNNDNL